MFLLTFLSRVLRDRELAGSVQASELNQVTELNLDNNLLSNVCELSALESLSVLRLNHNRIESGSLLQVSENMFLS